MQVHVSLQGSLDLLRGVKGVGSVSGLEVQGV